MPSAYDVLWSLAVLMILPLTVMSLLRWRAQDQTVARAVVWVLVILLLPGLGAAVYLAVTPSAGRTRRDPDAQPSASGPVG